MSNSFRRAPHRPLFARGYDGGGLDFYFRLALHEGNDLYDAHHGKFFPSRAGTPRRYPRAPYDIRRGS